MKPYPTSASTFWDIVSNSTATLKRYFNIPLMKGAFLQQECLNKFKALVKLQYTSTPDTMCPPLERIVGTLCLVGWWTEAIQEP